MSHQPIPSIYSAVGVAVVYLQSLEKTLRICTTFVLQDGEALDLAKLERMKVEERRKTLGQFVMRLKQRATLHPLFEDLVNSVLEDRNALVHDLERIPGWNLDSDDGLRVAEQFVMGLLARAHTLNEMLTAVGRDWARQISMDIQTTPEAEAYLQEIDKRYGDLVGDLFFHGAHGASDLK